MLLSEIERQLVKAPLASAISNFVHIALFIMHCHFLLSEEDG